MTATVPPALTPLPLATAVGRAPRAMTPAVRAIRLAGEHFAAAMLYLLAGALGLVWIAPELAAGAYLSPHVAGVTHLFTLGWLTMTIFGALYQLLPVALGTPVPSPLVGHASFWTFTPGVGTFAAGVATGYASLRHVGVTLVATGVVLAVANIAAALPRARAHDVTTAAIALAITFLAATLGLGLILFHNLQSGFVAALRTRALAVHLHVAIVGWVLITIVGVSHRLLPMFLPARHADTRWTGRALALLASGLPILTIGLATLWAIPAWGGLILLELGIYCFLRQAYGFYRARVRRTLEVGMRFAATALIFLLVSALLGPALLIAGAANGRLAVAYVVTGLLGGITLYVIGFFYKIVPMLAWMVHYSGRMGRRHVPTIAETFSSRVAHVQLAIMASAVTLLALGSATDSVPLAVSGAVLFLAGVFLFVGQLARVALGGSGGSPRCGAAWES